MEMVFMVRNGPVLLMEIISWRDQTGANLFQMTAPNGDFGNQTTHNFCITSNLSLDAGLSAISYPMEPFVIHQ